MVVSLESGELMAGQLALLPEALEQPDPALTLGPPALCVPQGAGGNIVPRLRSVYGPVFVQGCVVEATHPLPERRIAYAAWP